jgi:hemolysin activation/secretion protein
MAARVLLLQTVFLLILSLPLFAEELPVPSPSAPAPPVVLVRRIDVVGATALKASDFFALLAPYEGKKLALDDFKSAAKEVQEVYRARGYFLAVAYLPVQRVDPDGTLIIEVLEGRIGQILVLGNQFYSTEFIEKQFGHHSGDLLEYGLFERSLFLLNEFSYLTVRSVLREGGTRGTTDVVLMVEDRRPIHAGLDYNNFGSHSVGENRLGFSFRAGNLARWGDFFSLQGVYAFPSELDVPFLQGTYTVPINWREIKLSLLVANGSFRVGEGLTVLDIRGESDNYSLTAAYPMIRTVIKNTDLVFGLASKSARNTILGTLSNRDELREALLIYRENRTVGPARIDHTLSLVQGLGTLFGGMETAPDNKASRAGAGNSFTKVNIDWTRTAPLISPVLLLLHGSAQMATNNLVGMEQFGVGGSDTVRGYLQSERLGDHGYTVDLEVRFPFFSWKKSVTQGAFFLDHGAAYLIDPQVGEEGHLSLTGTGLGLRSEVGSLFSVRADIGFPIAPSRNGRDRSVIFYCQMALAL